MEQLSLCTATIVPTLLCNKRSHRNEKPVYCNWRVVPTHRDWRKATGSKDPAQTKINILNKQNVDFFFFKF